MQNKNTNKQYKEYRRARQRTFTLLAAKTKKNKALDAKLKKLFKSL